jgi:molybdopterin-containing oxidoreductase family iron-sulfur binding subunit
MKSNNTKYWKGFDELNQTEAFLSEQKNEFYEGIPLEEVLSDSDSPQTNRRDFLKFFGFSISAVTLAACNKTPVKYAIPYVTKPDNVTPGLPLYYASSAFTHNAGRPVLVKVREGRPIKLEPNPDAPFYGSGLDGLAHSSILSLYDTNRIRGPLKKGQRSSEQGDWAKIDEEITAALEKANSSKKIAIVSRNNTSLLMDKAVEKFKEKYENTEWVSYEPISYSGILNANDKAFGKKVIPTYHLQSADVIVSFNADFLGTWLNAEKAQSDYASNRKPESKKMSRHYQLESLMSMTGTNADVRIPMRSNKMGLHLIKLFNLVTKGSDSEGEEVVGNTIAKIAEDLKKNNGRAVVVCGSNDTNHQLLVNAINVAIGAYDSVIDLNNAYNGCSTDDSDFTAFVNNAQSGQYGAVIFADSNPKYSYPGFDKALSKVDTKISMSLIPDETARDCDYLTPKLHAFESWDILNPYQGKYVFNQPTISPVFNGRSIVSSLLAWSGNSIEGEGEASFDYLFTKQVFSDNFDENFNESIEKGFLDETQSASSTPSLSISMSNVISTIKSAKPAANELVLYQKIGIRDGSYSNNPWAHEMPDPVTKVCWDNYLTISKPDADEMKIKDNDVVSVSANGYTIDAMPVLVQPGQVKGSFGIALGYGRDYASDVKNDMKDLGKNAYPFVKYNNGQASYVIDGVKVEKVVGNVYELARTQTHNSIEARDIVRDATFDEYLEDPKVKNHHKHHIVSIWDQHDYSKGHHWAKVIDMNACNGCSACVVACSIENNVPIVGRDEVRRRREMHWIRIDRYYAFEAPTSEDLSMSIVNGGDKNINQGDFITQEKVVDAYSKKTGSTDYYQNVKTVYQPMMCQHCNHAPCETVCPVLATTHSSEGLNQMTYNRCIGTKYCANNCPYKVRRFNWFRYNENSKFDYHFSNDLGKMVINPDVTVRSRGVMEKCSMCVQRIQAAKLEAKKESRKMKTDEFTVACAQTCPSGAIVFGDLNDPESKIAKLYQNERGYHAIEEVGTHPGVKYLVKLRNTNSEIKNS